MSNFHFFSAEAMALGDQVCPQGTFNAAMVATLKRHYPERFSTTVP